MAPYVMDIRINNQTNTVMEYLGAAIYNGYGDLKNPGSDIAAQSTGNGGTLEKVAGGDGLFGLIAYSCPDPTQMLIIYVTMPAATGALNRCYVAVAPSNTAIGDNLANDAYNLALADETEGIMNYSFTQSGKSLSMQVLPKVNDTRAWTTFSEVVVSLAGSS